MATSTNRISKSSRRQKAFTLLEILIVVGITALLITLATIGFKVVGGASRARVTSTALENCKSLLETYKLSNSVDSLFNEVVLVNITTKPTTATPRWVAPAAAVAPTSANYSVSNCLAASPNVIASSGAVQTSIVQRQINARYLRDETARVIKRLSTVRENRAAIEAMPADRIVRVRYPSDSASTVTPAGDPVEYPLTPAADYVEGVNLLDGDSQPICFIPGGGLFGVNVGYQGSGDRGDPANYDRPNQTIIAPDRGPFWASPGPDGDLGTGDDNVYSFSN
ncbi:MAG TPA: type II secretion system protein [Tepidisphaeraceae bacterium]